MDRFPLRSAVSHCFKSPQLSQWYSVLDRQSSFGITPRSGN